MTLSSYCSNSSGVTRKRHLLNGVVRPANREEQEYLDSHVSSYLRGRDTDKSDRSASPITRRHREERQYFAWRADQSPARTGALSPDRPQESASRLREAKAKFLGLKAAQDRDASPGLQQFLRKRSEERQLACVARPAAHGQEPSVDSSRLDAPPGRDGDATQEPDEMTPATTSPLPQQVEHRSPLVSDRVETSAETTVEDEDHEEEIAVAAGRLVAAIEAVIQGIA